MKILRTLRREWTLQTLPRRLRQAAGQARPRRVVIDGVIFQLQAKRRLGIYRVWEQLLPRLAAALPDHTFFLLRRDGLAPEFPGVTVLDLPRFRQDQASQVEEEATLLGEVCRELGATLFLSTYYTRAPGVTNLLLVHDLIPELMGFDLTKPEWLAKQQAIAQAAAFFSISQSTQRDLERLYGVPGDRVRVAHLGFSPEYHPAAAGEAGAFRAKYNLPGPYFLLVGSRKNYKNSLSFFSALAALGSPVVVLAVGGGAKLLPEEEPFASRCQIRLVPHLSDQELRCAYSCALSLIYPSRYEGFGLPVLEAMACGCPVITGNISSLPEVGGPAALYVDPDNTQELEQALQTLLKAPSTDSWRQAGLARARQFSWDKMAEVVAGELRLWPAPIPPDASAKSS